MRVTADEPNVTPLPWWFPLLLLLALLFIWPVSVEVVATPPPPNADDFFSSNRLSEWAAAYGHSLDASLLRTTVWTPESDARPYLLATPWAQAFGWRLLALGIGWSILGVFLATQKKGSQPGPAWMIWTSRSLALFPWLYLLMSAGAGRGYAELVAATIDLRRVGEPITAYSTPIGNPPTETLIAFGALLVCFAILLIIEVRTTGKIPTLADLLQLDLEPRYPDRVLQTLPRLQRRTNVVPARVSATDGASSSEPADD